MNYHRYTDEEKQFCIDNINTLTYKQMADEFNTRFISNVNSYAMSDLCTKQLKIKRNKNTGNFAVRKDRPAKMPVGTEIDKSGYIWTKVDSIYHEGKTLNDQYKENWIQKQRLIYEQAFGEIPKGNIVVFLNGDRANFDINNLYSINRKAHAQMCKNNWYTNDKEHTLTAIKLCELACRLSE